MGIIHEKLTLIDGFSSVFNKFINQTAAGAAGAQKVAAGARSAEMAAAGAGHATESWATMTDTAKQRLGTLNESLERQMAATKKLQEQMNVLKQQGNNSKAVSKLRKEIEASQKSEYNYSMEIAKTVDTLKKASLQEQMNAVNLQKKTNALNKATKSLADHAAGAGDGVKKIGDKAKQASAGANTLTTSLRRLIGAAGGLAAFKKITELSDSITQTNARLNLMNDGTQSTAALYNDIYKAAQRARTPMDSFSDAVAKMGMNARNAFSSNQELIQFMENISKQYMIGGASAEEQKNSLMQLTQAMAAGALRGEELNSILDSAPGIARNIEKSMGWAAGSIKQYAEKGQVTAGVVKNAMLQSTEDINKQFKSMPMTFSQAATLVKNIAGKSFTPIGQMLTDAINSDKFAAGIDIAGRSIYGLTNIASAGFGMIGKIVDAAADNWYWLAPVIGIVAAAFIAYNVAVKGAAAAQTIYNAALAASPVTWIVIGMTLLVAAVVAAAAAFNHFGNTGNTVLGTIAGAIVGTWNVFTNGLKIVGNFFIEVAEKIVNRWNTGIYNIKLGFYNFEVSAATTWNNILSGASTAATGIANCFVKGANLAIKGINWIVKALNKIPGMDLKTIGEMSTKSISVGTQIDTGSIPKPTAPEVTSFDKLSTTSVADAWTSGWNKGSEIGNNATSKVSGALDKLTSGYEGLAKATEGMTSAYNAANATNGTGGKTNVGSVDKVKNVQGDVSLADEDIKMFRDLAERKYINKIVLKTTQPNITINQNNKGNGDADVKSMANKLAKVLEEENSESTDLVYE